LESRLGYDCGPHMFGAVSRCYQRIVLPHTGRVVLAAELGRFAGDTATAPGFREALPQSVYARTAYGSGCDGEQDCRDTGTCSSDVPNTITRVTYRSSRNRVENLCSFHSDIVPNHSLTCPCGYRYKPRYIEWPMLLSQFGRFALACQGTYMLS
jgi:hypothetical protein